MMKKIMLICMVAVLSFTLASVSQAQNKLSNFPNGFPNGVAIKNMPLLEGYGGNIFWVDSGEGSNGYKGTFDRPFGDIDYAVSKCTANNGDIIIVKPGHTETMTAADEIDLDVAGIAVVGIGSGTDTPTLSYTGTAGELVIGAANITVSNIRLDAGISAVVMGVSVEAAGDNCTLDNLYFPEPGTSTFEFLDAIDLETGADYVTIQNCTFFNADATGGAHFIEAGNGVNNGLTVDNCYVYGEFSVSAIWSDTADLETLIKDCNITNLTAGEHAIEFTAAATGSIVNCITRTNAQATSVDPGSMTLSGVLWDDETTANTAAVDSFDPSVLTSDPIYNRMNYFTVTADGTSATWNTVASHEIATVTGMVRLRIIAECTEALVGATATIELGTANNTAEIIAQTTATDIDATEIWRSATPDVEVTAYSDAGRDYLVVGGTDVGYTIGTAALTDGTLIFHVWWEALDSTGAVTAGAGGSL